MNILKQFDGKINGTFGNFIISFSYNNVPEVRLIPGRI